MAVEHPLQRCIVRVLAGEQAVKGAGFLISRNHIVTCAHVVNVAFGLDYDAQEKPEGNVHLDFPFIEMGHSFDAKIIYWLPPQRDSKGDIAVLEFDASYPAEAFPAVLSDVTDLRKHDFFAYGFPYRYDDTSLQIEGLIQMPSTTGRLQVHVTSNYQITEGFSGAPVWDETLKSFVGMIVQSDPDNKSAWFISVRSLKEALNQAGIKLKRNYSVVQN